MPWFLYSSLAVNAVLVLAEVLGTLWARQQDIRFRAALPFSLLGYEAVLGTPARSVRCEIEFAHACSPTGMITRLSGLSSLLDAARDRGAGRHGQAEREE